MRVVVVVIVAMLACGKKTDSPATGGGSGSATAVQPASDAAADPATACDGGDAASCLAAALAIAPTGAYRSKLSKEEADAKEAAATKLASKGCELGNGQACALVARYGPWVRHETYLKQSCDLGYVASCGSIGRHLADAGQNRKEREHAAELLEKACDADVVDWASGTSHHGGFCHHLYELYATELKDKAKAKHALERACAQGDKHKCACKTTDDCGAMPDDLSGDYDCRDGLCEILASG